MTIVKPPKFHEKESYKDWKKLAQLWCRVSSDNEGTQSAILMLNIDNKKAKKEILRKGDDLTTLHISEKVVLDTNCLYHG